MEDVGVLDGGSANRLGEDAADATAEKESAATAVGKNNISFFL